MIYKTGGKTYNNKADYDKAKQSQRDSIEKPSSSSKSSSSSSSSKRKSSKTYKVNGKKMSESEYNDWKKNRVDYTSPSGKTESVASREKAGTQATNEKKYKINGKDASEEEYNELIKGKKFNTAKGAADVAAAKKGGTETKKNATNKFEAFIEDVVNPTLQKGLEIIGGEFTTDKNGRISLTAGGAMGLATTAIITGATVGIGFGLGGVAAKVGTGAKAINVGSKAAQVGKVAVNGKTALETTSMLSKIALQLQKPAYIVGAVGAVIGTYPWAEWSQGEAQEAMSMAYGKALKSGDIELMQQIKQYQDELWDDNLWESIARLMPGTNLAVGFWHKYQGAKALKVVNDKILENEIIAKDTGETDDEKWERVREEEAEAEQAGIDYYNEERKKLIEWENEANTAQRKEDAAFWAKEREKQRENEAADRKAMADFWLAYKIQSQKLSDESRPSNLNFGLI